MKFVVGEVVVSFFVELDVVLEGWLMRVEDLLDEGDEVGVVKVLEGVIVKFLVLKNVVFNLGFVVVMSDLVRLYGFWGMLLKVDEFFSEFLFIKKKVEEVFFVDNFLWCIFLCFYELFGIRFC